MNNESRNKLKNLVQEVLMEIKKKNTAKKIGFKSEKSDKMKKSNIKGENTEMKSDSSKKITSSLPVKGKTEPNRPNKPSIPPMEKSSLKESIMKIIREEIENANLGEMARPATEMGPDGIVKGVGAKFVVPDTTSKTGYSLKGHPKFPDGTPAEKPKGPYVPKSGNPNMGRPKDGAGLEVATDGVSNIAVKVNGKEIGKFDLYGKLPSGKPDTTPLAKRIQQFIYRNPDMVAYSINPNVAAKIEQLSDMEIDGKLNVGNNILDLKVVGDELTA